MGTWPPLLTPLPEPSAHLSLSRCSLQLPLCPPGQAFWEKPARLRAFFLAPAATAGPDECAGKTGPCVTPPAHQHPRAPAGKAAIPCLGPHSHPRGQNQPPIAFRGLPQTSCRTQAPSRGCPTHCLQQVRLSGPIREGGDLTELRIGSKEGGLQVQPGVPKQRTPG